MSQLAWRIDGQVRQYDVESVACGIDWGGMGADPMVVLVACKSGPEWFFVDELYNKRMGHVDLLRGLGRIKKQYAPVHYWCDRSQAVAIGLLQSYGFPALPNSITDIEFGVRTIYGLIQRKRLHVDSVKCPHLWEEFRMYGYELDRAGLVPAGAKPADRFNHCLDAARYLLTGEGATPPEPIGEDLLETPAMYLDDGGNWRDNPRAHIAQRVARIGQPIDDQWWDETGDLGV